MSKLVRFATLAAMVPVTFTGPMPAAAAGVTPRLTSEALAQASFLINPSLSPDGSKLLARMSVDGKASLGVAELGGQGLELVPIPEGEDVRSYRWGGNNRIIFAVGARIPWYDRGDRYVTRAFVYDLHTHKAMGIGPKVQGITGDDILWIDPDGKELLLASQLDQFSYPSIFRVDLSNGKARLEQGPRDNVWNWYADGSGTVRYGVGYREHSVSALYRAADGGMKSLAAVPYTDASLLDGLYLVPGSDKGYALSPKATGRYAAYQYDFARRALGDLVFESKTNDVSSLQIDATDHQLMGADYTEDRARTAWLDPRMKAIQAKLDATFRARTVSIVSVSHDRARLVVLVWGPTDPGTYYLFSPATGDVNRLGKVAPQVDPAGLSDTKYVHYTARDGLDIPAYLTLPVGRDPKALPLVIMPHGGPYGVRDELGYNNEVQFLANRGYAVLQPNFRGSDGYGGSFYKKGEGQWGRAMQDDIDDGMDWLVKQGIADPKRVCIVGGSYGGYVALWGATRNPERYRCAVSFAGVSDLKAQLDYQSDFFTGTRWRKDWQNTVKGSGDFDTSSVSPLAHIDKLKVPIMLVHGDKDSTVPLKQTTLYDKALTAAGKPHETHIYPGEGHGFSKSADEKDYMDRLEAFLAKYNPA